MSEQEKKNKNKPLKEPQPKEENTAAPPLPSKKQKKKKWWLLPLILLILGALIFLFRKPILNSVRQIPFVGSLIGNPQNENLSSQALQDQITAKDKEIENLTNQVASLTQANNDLKTKNDSLKQYESMYTDFMAQKSQWDAEVAKTNPQLFIDQFEKMYPDNANQIYATLKGEAVLTDQQKQVATTVADMEEDKAAAALEKLLTTDPELIKTIFSGMAKDRRAAILSEMSSDAAAQVIKLISPDQVAAQ